MPLAIIFILFIYTLFLLPPLFFNFNFYLYLFFFFSDTSFTQSHCIFLPPSLTVLLSSFFLSLRFLLQYLFPFLVYSPCLYYILILILHILSLNLSSSLPSLPLYVFSSFLSCTTITLSFFLISLVELFYFISHCFHN